MWCKVAFVEKTDCRGNCYFMSIRKQLKKYHILRFIDGVTKIILLLAIALCVYVFSYSRNEQTRITDDGSITSVTHFTMNGTEEVDMPFSCPCEEGKLIVFSGVLPQITDDNYCLSFRSLYCINDVYVDEVPVGSYGRELPLSFGRMVGNIRVIVPLTKEMSEKKLTIVITPYYNVANVDFSGVEVGNKGDMARRILYENMFRLFVCVVLLTIMLVAAGIYLYQMIAKSDEQKKLIGSFICFDFLVVTWIICSSDIPQFFTSCNEGVSLISFLSLSIICIPFMSLCECVILRRAKIFAVLKRIGWLLPLTIGLCFVLNICDPMDILPATHIYMIICILITVILTVAEWKYGIASKFLLVGLIEIGVAAAVGLICWYMSPSKGYDAIAFSIGFVLFISTLFALIGYMQIKVVEDKKYMDVYKRLAYLDSLTMVKNRTAFEEKFAEMQAAGYKDVLVSLFMFDLNNLKKTNDSLGHQEGDKLIVATGKTLQKVFDGIGEVYRLGGDEFAVILIGYKQNLADLKEKFKNELQVYANENDIRISCAVGYAQLDWNPGDTFFRDIYKLADREMYTDKILTIHGEAEGHMLN